MSYHNAGIALIEGLAGGFDHSVPVPRTDVIRPHVSEHPDPEPRYRPQLGHRGQDLLWLEPGRDGTRGVVHLGGDGPARVDEQHLWQ